MNLSPAQDPTVKYYRSRQSAGVWTAGAVLVGVISVGPSFGLHSVLFTSSLLLGIIVVWYVGYWLLSKNLYFVSSTKPGSRMRSACAKFNLTTSAPPRSESEEIPEI